MLGLGCRYQQPASGFPEGFGAQTQGYDPTGGRAGNQVKVVPDGLPVQTVLLEVGQDLGRENAFDAAAID